MRRTITKAVRTTLAHLAAAAICAAAATPALADESPMPTSQATRMNADWVPYLDPPPKPAAICLVDTGVDVTPDTPADSPDGPILERSSLDGGPGTDVTGHGTAMAMTVGAPVNGWGTVGAWPGLRIVSIRAMAQGQTSFSFDDFRRSIVLCSRGVSTYHVVAINLALGCSCTYSIEQQSALENAIGQAHGLGISVVASAGNAATEVGMPAAASGILAIGAGAIEGGLCSFSNRGVGLDLIAPGCALDGAWPSTGEPFMNWSGGTSPASAIGSADLALLRSYRPDLDWSAAEQILTATGQRTPDGPALDLGAAFEHVGLGALVDRARNRESEAQSAESAERSASPAPAAMMPASLNDPSESLRDDRYSAPMSNLRTPSLIRIRWQGNRLMLSVGNRPRGAVLEGRFQRRKGEFGFVTVTRVHRIADRLTLRIPRGFRVGRVVLCYRTYGGRRSFDLYRRVSK